MIGRWARFPPWGLALGAMIAVQLGSALSIHLIDTVGPGGTAWLRLSAGALMFLAVARPPLRGLRSRDALVVVALGISTGLQTIAFLAAIERIPLGTCVAIEFLGPMTVAALHAHNRRAIGYPAVAALGVVLLTRPWQGTISALGVGFAALAAIGWAIYIVLTQRLGDRFEGIQGLTMSVPISALTAATIGVPQASGHLSLGIVPAVIGLALLLPVLPYALELQALRQMSQTAFGTLMALEPAIGLVIGLIALNQQPSPIQLAGITIVVLAGAAAQQSRHARRDTDRAPLGLGAAGSEAAPAGYGEIS